MRVAPSFSVLVVCLVLPGVALAHVSEGGFVLLLPTQGYIAAGVAVVALTVVAVFLLPEKAARGLFAWRPLRARPMAGGRDAVSLMATLVFAGLIWLGLYGPHDPLENLLPLGVWTIWWIVLIPLSAVLGDLWSWINPWRGLYRLIGAPGPFLRLPEALGAWPGVMLMAGFGAFMLADIAPADPDRLALFAGIYWLVTMGLLVLFGPDWLARGEIGGLIFRTYAGLAPLRLRERAGLGAGLGVPGWQMVAQAPMRGAGAFVLVLLAIGSFDGLNETFLWFGRIGINPLEFPGRSAVVAENVLGLGATILVMMAVFALVVRLGLAMAGGGVRFGLAFTHLALSLAPIALAYHLGHYLTVLLVNAQYAVLALNDPLESGARLLGFEHFHVTAGFFNRLATVRAIWITQGSIIVLGHVWSVLLGHRIALALLPDGRAALRATLPLSLLMIAFTFLGLWLLATPRA